MLLRHLKLSISLLTIPCCAYAGSNDDRPNEHYCPITLDVMKDPVVADDGYSYERTVLEDYLSKNNNISPMTRQPITGKLVANVSLRKMIQDWQPSVIRKPCILDQSTPEAIAKKLKEEFAKNEALLTQEQTAKGKNIVAFLGNTGSGKSTLINLLADKELTLSDDGEDFILANPNDETAMPIGTGGQSETLYPKAIDVDDLRFFDLPGFNDTDGSERNLINAAFIRKILLEAASVRLVFVAGQDQFTADRSNSVRQMFQAIQQLFVLADQTDQMIQNGVFVATKTTCNDTVDIIQFLLKKTDSNDKEALNQQLQSWYDAHKFYRIYHPNKDEKGDKNKGVKDRLLQAIQDMPAVTIKGLNVSALYPPETQTALEKMFYTVMQDFFNHGLHATHTTLSAYDSAITNYSSPTFWSTLEHACCQQEGAVKLLKEFCIHPYTKARLTLESTQENERQKHIQALKNGRQERIDDIRKRTTAKTQQVIGSIPQPTNGMIAFDFGYHKDFYNQVCGQGLEELATDPMEQEIVRSCYADVISQHSHNQVLNWMQKFGCTKEMQDQYNDMAQRLEAAETKILQMDSLKKRLDTISEKI